MIEGYKKGAGDNTLQRVEASAAEMWTTLLFASAVLLAALTTPTAGTPTYKETGDCEVNYYLRVMPIIMFFFML